MDEDLRALSDPVPLAALFAGAFLPVCVLAATACILGRTVLRRLSFAGRLERWAVSAVLGLALLAHLLLGLGLAGLLKPLPVLLLAVVIHVAGAPAWRKLWADLHLHPPRPLWGSLAVVGLAPLVLLVLYPPTAFDATMYHLPFARAFAESGGLPYLVDLRFPIFPQANEVLFATALLFGRDVAAHAVQLFATLLTALLLAAWGRNRRDWRNRPAGWLAAALFLGNPLVVYLATAGYIEAGLTLFVTTSLHSLDRWRNGGGRGWLALAAVLGATAADVKYLGLFFLGIAGLTALLGAPRPRPWPARLRDGLLFAAVSAAFLAPWYLRNYWHTGNPIFPYLPQVFGGSFWQSLPRPEIAEPLPHRLARWARIPWDVVFERWRYGQMPPFSPLYLAALPLLAFGAARDARIRRPLWIAGLYAFVCTWLPSDSRYFVPALPLASLALSGSVAAALRRWPGVASSRRFAAALCLGCLLPGWLYAGYLIARQGPLPVAPAAREAYLARALPLYPAIAWLNRTRGSAYTLWALHAESMAYFADGRFRGDWVGPASFERVLGGLKSPADLHRRLRGLRVDHLLVNLLVYTRQEAQPFPEDGELRRWFEPVYEDGAARVYRLRAL